MICDEECRVWATQKLKLAPLVVEVPLPRRVCVYPEVRVVSLRRAAKSGYVLGNLTSKVKSSCALSPGATPPGGATPPARAARLLARNSTERNKAARAVPRALLPLPGPSGSPFRSRRCGESPLCRLPLQAGRCTHLGRPELPPAYRSMNRGRSPPPRKPPNARQHGPRVGYLWTGLWACNIDRPPAV